MSLVLYIIAIGSVVVCVLFGLGYWRFAGMDGPRNGGFPYPRDEDLALPDVEPVATDEEPLTAKVAWAPTVTGASTATGAQSETETVTPEAGGPHAKPEEGPEPPEGDSNAPSTGDDGAPTAHMPDLSD